MSIVPWPERLISNVNRLAGKPIADEIKQGADGIKIEEDQAVWAKRAVDKIIKLIPDKSLQQEILTSCACPHDKDIVEDLRLLYEKTGDIDKVIKASYKRIFYTMPRRQNDTIYITKIAASKDAFDRASAETDKRRYYCHCLNVRTLADEMNPLHCYCGAGWYRSIFEKILGRPVTVELVKSLTRGDNECVIAIDI